MSQGTSRGTGRYIPDHYPRQSGHCQGSDRNIHLTAEIALLLL